MKRMKKVCVLLLVAVLAIGSAFPVMAEEKSAGYQMLENVSYGPDARNTMDVFVPDNLDRARENGAFLLIYGGSWTSGSKSDQRNLAKQYAAAGYVAVAINMRNATVDEESGKTTVTIYDMLNDVQGSVRKLKGLSDENGWNITQLALKGYSSGANVAMLYAYSRGCDVPWFDTTEILPVRFVVDLVGPVDMHDSAWALDPAWPDEEKSMTLPGAGPLYAVLLTGAANEKAFEEVTEEELETAINSMSPVWYVDTFGGIPTIMGYSVHDYAQNPNNGNILKGHLDARGMTNELFTFPNTIHGHYADPELAQAYFDKTLEYAKTYFTAEKIHSGNTDGNTGGNTIGEDTPKQETTDQENQPQAQEAPKTGESFPAVAGAALVAAVFAAGALLLKKSRR